MEQRDLIKDQIEQLGQVLGKIVADFLGLKTEGNVTSSIKIVNEQFKNQLDLDIHHLLSLSKHETRTYLKKKKMVESHLEILSKYLKEVGKSQNSQSHNKALLFFQKVIELLEIADEESGNFSFDRLEKKTEMEQLIIALQNDSAI